MPSTTKAIAILPHVDETPRAAMDGPARRSRVAEAWRIAMAHMQLGEIPIEQLDLSEPLPAVPAPSAPHAARREARTSEPSEAEIDDSVDDSFPASDPPSWSKSHA